MLLTRDVLCLKEKHTHIDFPTFKLPASTKNCLWLTIIILDDFGI